MRHGYLTAEFLWLAIVLAPLARGQPPLRVDPHRVGLDLPAGELAPGAKQAVTTHDEDGKPAVGRIHVHVGSAAIVLLPSGELVARREGEFAPTDRKFVALDKDGLIKRLATEFPGFKTKNTNHYVYVYNSSEEFQFGTSRILETMLPGVRNWFEGAKIDTHAPAVPLVVVMFRSEAEFRRHSRLPAGFVAYYEPLSNRVFMYEQSRLQKERPELALAQAISTIAHEGVHQILHNIGVQQRLSFWPMWLSEGLAEFFAPTSVTAKQKWKGPGQVNDLRMFELERYLKDRADGNGELVEHTVVAGQLTSTGYASAWALVHYLAKAKKPEFMALILDCSDIGPLCGAMDVTSLGIVPSNRESFVRRFPESFKDLEAKLKAHLNKLRPMP
jgi:hypothetical protein